MIELPYLFLFLLLGTVVGFMAGLLGIGGGTLLVPVLTAIFVANHFAVDSVVHIALGTSMASIVFTAIVSLLAHHRKQGVMWDIVKNMAPGVVLGAFAATFLATQMRSLHLALFFTLFLVIVAWQMLLNKQPAASRRLPGKTGLFFVSGGIGVISSLVAIGGGALTVPFLVWNNIKIPKAIGTSAALGLPIAVAGCAGYILNGWGKTNDYDYMLGYVHLPAVLIISIATYFTAPMGAKLTHQLPTAVIKKVFAIFLLLLSAKMISSLL